jgi:hypothetical protein
MPVLSNNGRLISSLPIASSITGADELLIQSNGVTKRIYYATISSSLFSSLSSYNGLVILTNDNNQFTGSFYNPDFKSSNFYTVAVRNTLTGNTIIATSGFSGNVTGNVTGNITSTGTSTFSSIDVNGGAIDGTSIGNSSESTIKGTRISASIGFRGNITSIGTSTFSNIDVNGGTIDGTSIGNSSESTIKGTRISASIGFRGNITGSLRGDIYSQNGNKVLENGASANPNGNIPTAFFYGTSSYAIQALTAAYAAAGGSAINGIPSGGTQYQVLTKNTGTNYDVGWITPITRSGVPNSNYLAFWNNPTTLSDTQILYTTSPNVLTFNPGTLKVKNIEIQGFGCITGSYKGLDTAETISSPSHLYKLLNGDTYPSILLELSASGYCTMSLMKGQTTTVLVKNSGNFNVLKWSGSLDGGSTADTKIYWKNGLSASITRVDQAKDIITFVNIDNKIFGSAINNFQ